MANYEKHPPVSEEIGQSEAFHEFQDQISQVAPINRPVLIIGERGTGKELAASRIHYLSRRWQKPLITLNCSALTPTLIGSELFGYEKGAFTGASARQTGRFEMANEGTLFLDEIGTIPIEVQEKILRVVEYNSFERVGSSRSITVDVRIVAATNADLPAMAQKGEFKADLLDRLSFEVVVVPPLRQRKDDIVLLANHFARRMAYELGWEEVPQLTDPAVQALETYPWPGNIRELKNVVERAVYKSPTPEISEIRFNPFGHPDDAAHMMGNPGNTTGIPSVSTTGEPANKVPLEQDPGRYDPALADKLMALPIKDAVRELEIQMLLKSLENARFNQRKAAKSLGLTYDQFRGLKKKHGI
ncbi:MAG: phage shock protein operon transcriptional activator [Desulfobacteraceae bacterium]|nr:MAG: phage shock protein operon transcriptional activator [Desulfobacteraceae bacterium]